MSDTDLNGARIRLLERVGREFEVFKKALASVSDPISALLRAHIFTEQVLEAHIRSWLRKPEDLLEQKLEYRVKLELAGAFGGIEDHILRSLRALNKVRNELAHQIDREITDNDISNIGTPLGEGFRKIKEEHPDDLNTQLGKLLPYLSGIFVGQVRGPFRSEVGETLKVRGRGRKHSTVR